MSAVRELSSVEATDFPEQWYDLMEEGHFLLDWRMRAFAAQLRALDLPTRTPLRGLDVGCGHGVLRRQVEAQTAWTVDGADVDRAALERNRVERGETLLYDVRDRRPELLESYDFALLFDVLEHLAEPSSFIRAIAGHLKPGGWLFVNVPAIDRLASPFDRAVGHLRRYDRGTLEGELAGLPLAARDMRYWGFSMLPYLLIRKFASPPADEVRRVIERGLTPPAAWMTPLITGVARAETSLLRRPPLGVSLLMAARRTD